MYSGNYSVLAYLSPMFLQQAIGSNKGEVSASDTLILNAISGYGAIHPVYTSHYNVRSLFYKPVSVVAGSQIIY